MGDWQVDAARSQKPGLKPAQQSRLDAAYAAFRLTLKQDHTFNARLFLPVEGSWSIEGDKLTLEPSKGPDFRIGGQALPSLKVEEDGRSLILVAEDPGSPGRLVLIPKPGVKR